MMSPARILYLQSTAEISGTDLTLLRTVEVLDHARFEPHVVLPSEGPLGKAYREAGARVYCLPTMRKVTSRKGVGYLAAYLLGYPVAVAHLVHLIRREQIQLVHTNSIHNWYGFLAARLTGTPHVWHIREIVVQSRVVRVIEQFFVTRYSTRFIVMSDAIAEPFRRRGGDLPGHAVKLYDGLDLEAFSPRLSGTRIRRELGILDTAPFIGTVCRLDPWKGVNLFLEAAVRIHRVRSDARFLVCGGEIEGHEGEETTLVRQARALGIRDAVFFTGWRYRHRDIPAVYRALDVAVQCPINPEPYGLANIEAMACGVPLVAVAQGGPTELCPHGDTALLVPPRDPEATAAAVLTLLNNPARARAMGMAGRRRAEALFDRRRCVDLLETLYEEVLHKAPPRAVGLGGR